MKTQNTDYESGYADGYKGEDVDLSKVSEEYKRGYRQGHNDGLLDDMIVFPDDWWWL